MEPCLLTAGLAFTHARLCRADAFLVGETGRFDGENVLLREVRRKAAAVIGAEADGRSLAPKEKNSRPLSALQLGDNEKTVAKAGMG
jgi:hypothetical protein